MRTIKPDRRVRKTKEHLSQALFDLMREKEYKNITIQDILRRAKVGRSTFYAHYENKEMLLMNGPSNLGLSLFGKIDLANQSRVTDLGFPDLFTHIDENRDFAKTVFEKTDVELLLGSFRQQIAMAIQAHYAKAINDKEMHQRLLYLSQAAAAAISSLITSWVYEDLDLSVDKISAECRRIILGIVNLNA